MVGMYLSERAMRLNVEMTKLTLSLSASAEYVSMLSSMCSKFKNKNTGKFVR